MTMKRAGRFLAAVTIAAAVAPTSHPNAQAPQGPQAPKAQAAAGEKWETAFRAIPVATNIRAYDERLSARPHHVGSPYDKDNAEWMLARFKEWGWDAKIETLRRPLPDAEGAAARDGRADALRGEARRAGRSPSIPRPARRPSSCPPTTPTRSTATSRRRSST